MEILRLHELVLPEPVEKKFYARASVMDVLIIGNPSVSVSYMRTYTIHQRYELEYGSVAYDDLMQAVPPDTVDVRTVIPPGFMVIQVNVEREVTEDTFMREQWEWRNRYLSMGTPWRPWNG